MQRAARSNGISLLEGARLAVSAGDLTGKAKGQVGHLVLMNLDTWNGLDDFGNKIGKGVYVYKLHVRSQITTAQAEKFEKLVILQ